MTLTKEIKIGDFLFSKEYGCKVTVEAFTIDNRVVCVWFNENQANREILQLNDLEEIN